MFAYSCIVCGCFLLQQQIWEVATETLGSMKPGIFTHDWFDRECDTGKSMEVEGTFQVTLMVKKLSANAEVRDVDSVPGLGRFPGGGHGNPMKYSCLENPLDRGVSGGLQSMGSQRVGYDWVTKHSTEILNEQLGMCLAPRTEVSAEDITDMS